MNYQVTRSDHNKDYYNVLICGILVGELFFNPELKTGWYEDEDRGYFTCVNGLGYDDIIKLVGTYYGQTVCSSTPSF